MNAYTITLKRVLDGKTYQKLIDAKSLSEAFIKAQDLFPANRWKILAVKK